MTVEKLQGVWFELDINGTELLLRAGWFLGAGSKRLVLGSE